MVIPIDTLLSSLGGGSVVAVSLYYLIRANGTAIRLNSKSIKVLDKKHNACTARVAINQADIAQDTQAIIQHLIATDREAYPDATRALEQVLDRRHN